MRVDYRAFDKVYQRLRAEGSEWNTPEQLAETLGLLLKFFDIGDDRKVFLSNAHRVLRHQGIFHVAIMCGEIHDPEVRAAFDPPIICIIRDGMAIRQVEMAADILREIEGAGFRVLHWEIDPPARIQDQADLSINATN